MHDRPQRRLSCLGSLDLTSVINLEALCAMSCPRSASLPASSRSTALGGSLSGPFGQIVGLYPQSSGPTSKGHERAQAQVYPARDMRDLVLHLLSEFDLCSFLSFRN